MLKVKRILSLIFGLAAMTFTGYHVYNTIIFVQRNWKILQSIDVEFILRMIFYWPITVIRLEDKFMFFKSPFTHGQFTQGQVIISPLGYGFLVTYLGAIIISIVLAKSLNRSFIDWGILSFIFPYLAPTILVFKKKKPEREGVNDIVDSLLDGILDSIILKTIVVIVGALLKGGTVMSGNESTSKVCGRCGAAVDSSASAGQRCPHCDAYWSSENKIN